MDLVAALQLEPVLDCFQSSSFYSSTSEMFAIGDNLNASQRKKINSHADALQKYLRSRKADADHQCVADHERLLSMRENLPQRELIELACLEPVQDEAKHNSPASQVKVPGKLSEYARISASSWLIRAMNCFESFELLPPQLQRDWIGLAGGDAASIQPARTVEFLKVLCNALTLEPCPLFAPFHSSTTTEMYLSLTPVRGRKLAKQTMGLLESGTACGREMAEHILSNLTCLTPGSLRDVLPQLVEHRVFSHVMYTGASDEVRDQLIAIEPQLSEKHLAEWVQALGAIADEESQQTILKLQKSRTKRWRKSNWYIAPLEYAFEAGWDLTREGLPVQLYFDKCFPLIPATEAPDSARPGPIESGTPRNDKCGHCNLPLTNVLDVDLKDRRLKFTGLKGSRLRIVTCSSCWSCVYSSYDTQGNAAWSKATEPPYELPEEYDPVVTRNYVLGPATRTPLVPLIADARNWLGGRPDFINDAHYPNCPQCRLAMTFLASVPLRGGEAYVFICQDCKMAATTCDCT